MTSKNSMFLPLYSSLFLEIDFALSKHEWEYRKFNIIKVQDPYQIVGSADVVMRDEDDEESETVKLVNSVNKELVCFGLTSDNANRLIAYRGGTQIHVYNLRDYNMELQNVFDI